MDGMGIVKGLGVTLKRFIETYLDDIQWLGKRYYTKEGVARRMSTDTRGIFTIQYPEEKLVTPEEFRYIPFLLYEEGPNGERKERCTSCGICAKVCPPQCIWIVRTNNPATGRPVPVPSDFFIDADICMNCGLCAEYCPFDAIKMDHDFEIASYERNVLNIDKLLKSASYYASIRPQNAAREDEARRAKKAAKAVRAEATAA